MAVRTILYAFADDSGKTLAERRESAKAAGFHIDAMLCEEAGFNPRTTLFERPRGASLFDALAHGDTLIIPDLKSLGPDYVAMSAVLHAFMRRGVTVKTVADALVFDGATQDSMARAARDALIAFASARAEAEKAKPAKAPPRPQRRRLDDEAISSFDRQSAFLQLRVSLAQIAILGLAVYGAASFSHGSHAPTLGATVEEAQLEGAGAASQQAREGRSVQRRPWAEPDAFSFVDRHAPPAPKAPEPLSLSRDEQLKVLRAVVTRKVVRIRRASFPLTVGAVVPSNVSLATFPSHLTAQMPHFRGYKFFVVDNKVAIVDPATLRLLGLISG